MIKSRFKNEIGNAVIIKMKNVRDRGTNHKTGDVCKFDAINIQIIGPTSVSDNTITYKEARELHKGLGKLLHAK